MNAAHSRARREAALPTSRARRALVAALALTAAMTSAQLASAQEPFGLDAPAPAPPAPGGTEQAVVARYWELGRVRWFAAATLESGYAYARPRFAVGYGQPNWYWLGLETYPLASVSGLGYYGGLNIQVPGLNLRAGGRYVYPFRRSLLTPQESYGRTDLDLQKGPRADYLALEAEATITAPIAFGSAFFVLSGTRTELVDDGYYLYEESLRAVIKPPYIARARLGYLFALGWNGALRLGPAMDGIILPGRDEYIIRGGVLGSVLINAHLEAQASVIPVLVSPDQIGLAGGDFGQLGVRFRWATDSTPDPTLVKKAVEERRAETEAETR